MLALKYGFTRTLPAASHAAARRRFEDALMLEGFLILAVLPVQAVIKSGLRPDHPEDVTMGASLPALVHGLLLSDPAHGLLVPVHMAISECGRDALVSILDPALSPRETDDPLASPVHASAARERMQRALANA